MSDLKITGEIQNKRMSDLKITGEIQNKRMSDTYNSFITHKQIALWLHTVG